MISDKKSPLSAVKHLDGKTYFSIRDSNWIFLSVVIYDLKFISLIISD
jgi:hypothetical protein